MLRRWRAALYNLEYQGCYRLQLCTVLGTTSACLLSSLRGTRPSTL